jgi:hypothetical protein
MKIELTSRQAKLLDLLLGLDLEALGLSRGDQRVAHSIHLALHEDRKEPIAHEAPRPLNTLRLTPSYRHEDK